MRSKAMFLVHLLLMLSISARDRHFGLAGEVEYGSVWSPSLHNRGVFQPGFSNNSEINITAHMGDTVFLPCRARNLGDRTQRHVRSKTFSPGFSLRKNDDHSVGNLATEDHQDEKGEKALASTSQQKPIHVTWIKQPHYNILTSGKKTFIRDDRFQALDGGRTGDWALQVKSVELNDGGTYECQISTGTGVISTYVNLIVMKPVATINGSRDRHVDLGSTITLQCTITKIAKPLDFVIWYRNDTEVLNYDTMGHMEKIETRLVPLENGTLSQLTIRDATFSDTGNYTCSAQNTDPVRVQVYVSEGDIQAPVQRKTSGSPAVLLTSLVPALSAAVMAYSMVLFPAITR